MHTRLGLGRSVPKILLLPRQLLLPTAVCQLRRSPLPQVPHSPRYWGRHYSVALGVPQPVQLQLQLLWRLLPPHVPPQPQVLQANLLLLLLLRLLLPPVGLQRPRAQKPALLLGHSCYSW